MRAKLAHYPIAYSLIAATAIVIFWRSVWGIADYGISNDGHGLSYVYSLIVSTIVLLLTGLFTSFFVGDTILISGLKKEKKLIEKTEDEVDREGSVLKRLQSNVSREESILLEVQKELKELREAVYTLQHKNPQ